MYTRRYRPQQQFAAPVYTQPRHHEFSPFAAEQSYYVPSQRPSYDDYYAYEEPSEFDELAYEEERLIEAQRQIEAQRRRIAEERRRIARLAEQKRYQEYLAQQEAQRRAQWLQQQRYEQQQKQAALQRKRQAAAIKEAQLEAALRELEFRDSAHAAEQQRAEREVHNPLELLFGLFSPSQKQSASRSAQSAASRCANRCTRQQEATPKTNKVRAELPSATSSKPVQTNNAAPAPSKPSVASILSGLQSRIDSATEHVSSLFATDFDHLSLGQFGKVDNELMNILLALDDINVDSEEAREARKALVKETVSLLERVDQRKDAYSTSSSEASSNHGASDAVLEESDNEEEVQKKQVDEVVEEIDADSEGSEVESNSSDSEDEKEEAESTQAKDESAKILPFAFENLEEPSAVAEASVEASESETKTDEAVVDDSFSALVDFADSFADVEHDSEQVEEQKEDSAAETQNAPSSVEEDPFGLKGLRNLSKSFDDKKEEELEYQATIPIKIRSKASVTIESAPATSQ